MTTSTIRVLIADDHPLYRNGVRERLDHAGCDIEVIGEADDGRQAVELVDTLRPNVVLMDISMPHMSGIEATRRIKELWPEVPVLILTVYDDEQYVFALLEAGAAGYLLKTVDGAELCGAIRRVHEGESVLSPPVARKVLSRFTPATGASRHRPPSELLSEREREILQRAARGVGNKEIAVELGLSIRTVQNHLSHIFEKLGVASRTEAVVVGLRAGWLHLEDLL